MFELVIYGDPVLRKKTEPVENFDGKLRKLVEEMMAVLHEAGGVGLAAPQIGESIRLVVIDPTGGEEEPIVLINPEFVYKSEMLVEHDEGCLSFPDLWLPVERSSIVSVKACDIEGKEYIIENAEGLMARALQHEIDHLNGILIVDHVSALKRQMLSGKLKKMAKFSRDNSKSS